MLLIFGGGGGDKTKKGGNMRMVGTVGSKEGEMAGGGGCKRRIDQLKETNVASTPTLPICKKMCRVRVDATFVP